MFNNMFNIIFKFLEFKNIVSKYKIDMKTLIVPIISITGRHPESIGIFFNITDAVKTLMLILVERNMINFSKDDKHHFGLSNSEFMDILNIETNGWQPDKIDEICSHYSSTYNNNPSLTDSFKWCVTINTHILRIAHILAAINNK